MELDLNKYKKVRTCPGCGGTDIVPIVYGYPTAELLEQAKNGEVNIGGCDIDDERPWRFCKSSEHAW